VLLPELLAALREEGHDHATVTAIAHGNWLRVLGATW
jgi:microsomal dipeptidase-like Zn-dependent dipeptidase